MPILTPTTPTRFSPFLHPAFVTSETNCSPAIFHGSITAISGIVTSRISASRILSGRAYCNICNFFQYSTSIMTNDAVRTAHLKDTTDLYADIASGDLPGSATTLRKTERVSAVDTRLLRSWICLKDLPKKIVGCRAGKSNTVAEYWLFFVTFDEKAVGITTRDTSNRWTSSATAHASPLDRCLPHSLRRDTSRTSTTTTSRF